MRILKAMPMAAVTAFALCLLAGCGGSGNGSAAGPGTPAATGRVVLNVDWPESTRLIPARAQSIRVVLLQVPAGATAPVELADTVEVIPRSGSGGTSTYRKAVIAGDYILRAQAYPDPSTGSNVVLAAADVPVTVVGDQTSEVTVTLNSTINRLKIGAGPSTTAPRFTSGAGGERPYALTLPTATLPGEESNIETLTVVAVDGAGRVVLVTPGSIAWSASQTGKVTFDATGQSTVVTGIGSTYTGPSSTPVTLRATDTESGISETVAVNVFPVFTLEVSKARVDQGDTSTIVAVPRGFNTASFDFSVSPSAPLSPTTNVTQTTFTAPISAGGSDTIYRVLVTSREGPATRSVDLTVPPIVVSITSILPDVPPRVNQGGSATFTATITGALDKTADWFVAGTPLPTPSTVTGTTTFTFNAPITQVASDVPYTLTARSHVRAERQMTITVVVPALTVTVSPLSTSAANGQTRTFTATVNNIDPGYPDGQAVDWSIDAGSNGSIDQNGVYTAPLMGVGSATVRATSRIQPKPSGTATVAAP
jgi:hypothetical protein